MEIIKMSNAKVMNATRTGLKLYCDNIKVGTVVAYDEAADIVSVEVDNSFAAMTENQEKMSQCHLEFKMENLMQTSCKDTMERKYYGRIFCEKPEDVQKIEDIMREIDEYEFDNYYPTGNYSGGEGKRLVTVFDPNELKAVYTGKFDEMNIGEVLLRAWSAGI